MDQGSSADLFAGRRARNASCFAAFGTTPTATGHYRTVVEGSGPTVYTIGYERRNGEDLVARLLDAGVKLLLDVRERPLSRNPDFRRGKLERFCIEAGIRYESWPDLGSTDHQRTQLREQGDFAFFRKRFRETVKRRTGVLDRLAELVAKDSVAMLCYERAHEECHRCILADLLHEEIDATVVAIA